jgi:AcrR family transcriptional regulator
MTEAAVHRRPGGRSARVRQSVLDATLASLAEGGLDKLTVADVAERAGVHETSIRRRWRTKEDLISDALLNNSEQYLPIPDTGSIREDLATFAAELAAYLTTPLGRALIQAMTAAGEDAALAEARTVFWQARYELASAMLERAVDRGELPATVDSRLALEALIAPLNFRALLTGAPPDDALPSQLADLVLDGISGGSGVGAEQRSSKRGDSPAGV